MSAQMSYTVDELGTATHVINRFLNEQDKSPPVEAVIQEVDETLDDLDRHMIGEIMDDDSVYTDKNSFGNTVVTDVTVRGAPPSHLDGFIADGGVVIDRSVDETVPIQPSIGNKEADFTDFEDISNARADALKEAGYSSFNDVHSADVEDITAIEGFRDTLAEQVKNEASRRLDPIQQIAAKSYEEKKAFEEQGPIEDSVDDLKTVASDVSKPIGPTIDEEYYGLTVHEEIDHPFIEDVSEYDDLKTRDVLSGEEDISLVGRLIEENNYTVVLEGHAGVGKNYLLGRLFAETNRPVLRINVDSSMLSKDLLGVHKIGANRQVVWDPGPVPKAVQNGWCIVIDEPNLAREGVMMCLQQLSEKEGKLHVKGENSVIEPHPAFRAVFTQNPATTEYRGTEELNSAFTSRLFKVPIPYLDEDEEADLLYDLVNDDRERLTRANCSDLVDLANRFRNRVDDNARLPRITTRDLQKVASAADGPVTVEDGTRLVINGCLSPRDDEEAAMNIVTDAINS